MYPTLIYFFQDNVQGKGMDLQVRHGPSTEKGHDFLGQAWPLHRERAGPFKSGMLFVTLPSLPWLSLYSLSGFPPMIGVCQALSALRSFVVFWFLVGYLPFIFSISLHGYNNICSNFINF